MPSRNSRNNNNIRPRSALYGGDSRGLYGSSSYGRRNTMIYGKPPRRWPKVLIAVIVILLILFAIIQFGCGGLPFLKHKDKQEQKQEQPAEEQQQAATGPSGTISITAVGDCTLGTDINFMTDTNFDSKWTGDPAYYLQRVQPYMSEDDLTIVNFEGTLTTSEDRQDKEFAFKGPAEYAKILTAGGVEAANLANNHSYDYGEQSYEDTKKNLADEGIVTFGYDRVNTFEANGIKVGLFGVNCVSSYETATEQMNADIKQLEQEGCQLIIGCFHWGTEGNYDPDQAQVDLAHQAIDAGCDLVLGSHPHVLQGIEVYNGHYILYSLGNFCFGGNDSPADFRTMMWQQTFTIENGEVSTSDEALKNVSIIPCRVSSTSTTLNDYQPLPLGGDEASDVITLINDCSAKLSGTGVKFNTTVDDQHRSGLVNG